MTDKDKVIGAFERCFCEEHEHCPGCYQDGPGFGIACRNALCLDVLKVLKEQKAEIEELNCFINGFSKEAIVPVRCKDCKHILPKGFCHKHSRKVTDDWFCADGEHK